MSPSDVVSPPPIPRLVDYPGVVVISFVVIFTTILLIVAGRFDPTSGTLTISLLVVLAFFAVLAFAVFFTIPNDEATSAAVGGLIAAFGAIIAYWLGRPREPPQ